MHTSVEQCILCSTKVYTVVTVEFLLYTHNHFIISKLMIKKHRRYMQDDATMSLHNNCFVGNSANNSDDR